MISSIEALGKMSNRDYRGASSSRIPQLNVWAAMSKGRAGVAKKAASRFASVQVVQIVQNGQNVLNGAARRGG
jgi:hypothetical protein